MKIWRWQLCANGKELGRFQCIRGLYREEVGFEEPPKDRLVAAFGQLSAHGITILGLDARLRELTDPIDLSIRVLDASGACLGNYSFELYDVVNSWRTSSEKTLSTIDIRGLLHSRIERGCLLVWDYRRAGFPIEKNEWATWKPSLWPAWLDVARNVSNFSPKTTHQQDRFFFDCEYVVDETSFFCALGETMQGPGGYYGKDLDSMEDCLCGGFGPVPPFEIKLRSLRTSVANSAFYEEAVSILEENGVSVAADRN